MTTNRYALSQLDPLEWAVLGCLLTFIVLVGLLIYAVHQIGRLHDTIEQITIIGTCAG